MFLLFLIKWQQTPAAPSSSMTKIGRACFILGIFLQTGWGRTLITSCSPWWWSWETFSATWAPANETSLARSYWNESGERLELAGCMLIMLLSWGSLCGACVDSASVWGFLLFLYIFFFYVRGMWASLWFLWERRASEGGLLMSACAVSVSSFFCTFVSGLKPDSFQLSAPVHSTCIGHEKW